MPQAMSFQTSDPRPNYFDPIIRRIQDTGIMDFYFKRHMPPRAMKDNTEEPNEPIILDHLFIPVAYSILNLFLAIIIFVWEKYLNCSTSSVKVNKEDIANINHELIHPKIV